MKLNRKGVTRLVLELKTVVIKFPNPICQWSHFLKGLLANPNESRVYKCASTPGSITYNHRHLLCPVRWCSWGGWILVMTRVDRVMEMDEYDKYPMSEFLDYFPGDDTVSNYGILNGNLVKLDYGQ